MTAELPAPAATGPRFDPTDPADLERLAEHLHQRTGRTYTLPAPFEFPEDAGDPNTGWQTYPEHPAVRHYDRATRTIIDVSFPGDDTFRIFGWVWDVFPRSCRVIDRSGRFHNCGPATLAWVLGRLIETDVAGDWPRK